MADHIFVMRGSWRPDLTSLRTVAREFGWEVAAIDDPAQFPVAGGRAAAILVCPDALGPAHSLPNGIRLLNTMLPEVPVIVCQGFAESMDWPELSAAGAFHTLWLPLKENEIRQSFGFVSRAAKRFGDKPAARSAARAAVSPKSHLLAASAAGF